MTTRRDWALGPEQRADARAALALLEGSGLSLEQAARRALQGRNAGRRVSVAAAAEEFLRSRLKRVRGSTYQFYEYKLGVLVASWGEAWMDDVSRADFRAWLAALPGAEVTRAGYLRAARALWRWAKGQEPPLVAGDVTEGVEAAGRPAEHAVGVLSVEQAREVLVGVPAGHRAALALMLFAGVRTDEVRGAGKEAMRWEHVHEGERIVRVPAGAAKSGRARILEGLPETVWAWLGTPGRARDAICPAHSRAVVRGIMGRWEGTWPKNALRHSFASYAVALTGDPGKVALWLGHEGNPTMLHRHYRGLVTKAQAAAFFSLRPS